VIAHIIVEGELTEKRGSVAPIRPRIEGTDRYSQHSGETEDAPKNRKEIGASKNAWCEFHQAYGHPIRNCLLLGHQLAELVKNDFLKDYLQEPQGVQTLAASGGDQGHEMPVHGEIHTISGGFSGGGCTVSQRKKYDGRGARGRLGP